MAYLVVSSTLEKLEKGLMTRSLVPSSAGREGGKLTIPLMAYMVVGCILENLENGLMTRSLVPSCAGREDWLLEVSCILKTLEKGLMMRCLHVEGGKAGYWRKVLEQLF